MRNYEQHVDHDALQNEGQHEIQAHRYKKTQWQRMAELHERRTLSLGRHPKCQKPTPKSSRLEPVVLEAWIIMGTNAYPRACPNPRKMILQVGAGGNAT
eukprot:2621655-Pyramimonas_sp.AAC.1